MDTRYEPRSAPVQMLVGVLASFTPPQRRQFLMWATGAPRLPPEGFAGLNPRLTVVRKELAGGAGGWGGQHTTNAWLPTISTCQVYLKWPAYSSEEMARTQLVKAITEGSNYFALD